MASNVEDIYELSPLQQGMLLHSVHDGASDMYLSQHTYSVDGPLDVDVLVAAWQRVVAAHPALRTSFHWQGRTSRCRWCTATSRCPSPAMTGRPRTTPRSATGSNRCGWPTARRASTSRRRRCSGCA